MDGGRRIPAVKESVQTLSEDLLPLKRCMLRALLQETIVQNFWMGIIGSRLF